MFAAVVLILRMDNVKMITTADKNKNFREPNIPRGRGGNRKG